MTTGEEGHSTQRRSKVFTRDPYLYDIWAKGGSVWLDRTATEPVEGDLLRRQERGDNLDCRRFLQVQKMNPARESHQKRKKRIIYIVPQERGEAKV